MNKIPVVLITGATGAVGPLVVDAFHKAGYAIRTLSLDAPPKDIWPENIESIIGDVNDAAAVEKAVKNVDAVIHLAALLHIVNPPPALHEKYERINVGGTATVVDEAIKAGVKRVVLFSTIAVYGPSNGRMLTEDTPPCPDTFYAQTKLAAEKIVLEAKGADGRKIGTVLRLGAVYGARIKGNYRRLLLALAHGRFTPIGSGKNRRTLVYDKDAARAAVLALRHADCAGEVFNITDGRFHEMNTIIETLCGALGRPKPGWSVPVGPVRTLAGVIEDASRLFGRTAPIVRATIDKYTEDVAVDGSRFQTRTGFSPKYDLAAGWRETVAEMKRMGEL